MNVIVIYHQPQECGSPYLTFISQETGMVVETVDIPQGFYNSGIKREDVYTPVYSFVEKVNQTPKPTVDNVRISAPFRSNPKRYEFRVTKVDNIQEDNEIFKTWTADVYVDACIHDVRFHYSTHRDHFRKQLSKAGFDMRHWTLTKRMKTSFIEFLRDICSKYKDYHLVNILQIY